MRKTILTLCLVLALLAGAAFASQNSVVIANDTGANVRTAINNAFNTVVTLFSGPSSPATTYAYQLWADTGSGYHMQRNSTNAAWTPVRLLDPSVPVATYATDTYTANYTPAITSLKEGAIFQFKAGATNTVSPTYLKINSLTAKYIVKGQLGASYHLDLGDTVADLTYLVIYNSTLDEFILLNPGKRPIASFLGEADVKSAGTNGGTFTAGSWQTRTLNATMGGNTIMGASVGSNQITLPAGSYNFKISCPAYAVDQHQAVLYNVTNSTVTQAGSSEYAPATGGVTRSLISGRITITGTKVFEVRHRCTTTRATDGLGKAANLGQAEIYTQVEIWQE